MSLLQFLPKIIEESREEYLASKAGDFVVVECTGGENILAQGDNMAFMKYLAEEKALTGELNLVYIDPPFFSKTNYGTEIKLHSDKIKKVPALKQIAYYDRWDEGLDTYLKMLCVRFYMIKDLLADDGCLWVHLDWHAAHYVKVLLDEIFGEKQFINEIIWNYKSGGSSKKHFAKKHDTLLFYSKTSKYYFKPQKEKSYNRGYKPYRFKGVKEYRDELGWYTMVNMKDVWQIDMVGRTAAERTGYVTQKPEALLERVIESCTCEGDLCADFFGGAGTLAAAAEKLGRKWISCDIGKLAVINQQKRLAGTKFSLLEQQTNENKSSLPSIDIKVDLQPIEFTDKVLLTIDLLKYTLSTLHNIPVDEKNKVVIKKIMKEDSLQLVDYWSIDCHYDGLTHRPQKLIAKDKSGLNCHFENMGNYFDRISIRIVDIFGNSLLRAFRIGDKIT